MTKKIRRISITRRDTRRCHRKSTERN